MGASQGIQSDEERGPLVSPALSNAPR